MSRKAGSADPAITRDTAESLANAGRLKQMRMVAGLIRKSNPKALPIIIGSGLGILAILVIVFAGYSLRRGSSQVRHAHSRPTFCIHFGARARLRAQPLSRSVRTCG